MAEGREEGQVKGQPESHQALKRAVELRSLVIGRRELYGNREAWTAHQQLAGLYRRLLLGDLEFALDRKVEQDLWNNCFKSQISNLQAAAKEKRNAKAAAEANLTLSWFLEMASGFYILLLQEVGQSFSISLPFFQSADPYGQWREERKEEAPAGPAPTRTSCHYVCQHCLVHLGDIARYRGQGEQAEAFYRHAISLAPSSGQPYNQIAILEASRQNRLATVYFYVRAVSLRCPFPAAATNLAKLLGRLGEGDTRPGARVTAQSFPPLFLRLHGQLLHAVRPRAALAICDQLCEALTALVVEEALTGWQLVQVAVVNMWAWEQAQGGGRGGEPLSREEQMAGGAAAALQAALLLAILLPVYTLQQGRQLLDYHALPALRLLLDWLLAHPAVLRQRGFTGRPQIWPGLARLLNEVTPLVAEWAGPGPLAAYPLPEDWELQAFLPLAASAADLDPRLVGRLGEQAVPGELALLRCHRLLEAAGKLGVVTGGEGEAWRAGEAPAAEGEDLGQLVARMEAELLEDIDSSESEPEWEAGGSSWPAEATRSILKQPEGEAADSAPRPRAPARNVAMAAILRQAALAPGAGEETERKTVMFLTPSPGSSQTSGPPEEEEAGPGPPWSPPARISVQQLDFSVPPPSLHSNFRPPALSAPALYCPDTDSIGGVARRQGGLQGIAPIQPGGLSSYTAWSHEAADSPALARPPSPPLLHSLLASAERPGTLGLAVAHEPVASPWAPLAPRPPSPPAPSYSLFSPSAWPPPSLLSPQASPHHLASPRPSPHPSPLERLLGQAAPPPGPGQDAAF